ncbi:hypothetical protein [Klebsiella quasipneumoniae]|uniref:hypothetical protein n=2 Tax=Enterobacterales TaxID=91347 RepID=UPI002016D611
MTTLEALASRVDVYSIDEAFLDLTGIDRVVSFEPFGRQAIWLKVESPDGYVPVTYTFDYVTVCTGKFWSSKFVT